MRALTVRQPWAWAIVHGGKDVENRSRNVAGSYRGPVAIHAGLTEDVAAYDDDMIREALGRVEDSWVLEEQLAVGAVLGVVDLVEVHEPTEWCSWWGQSDAGVHLTLANPRPLARPVPCRGALGLWTLPPGVRDVVLEQLITLAAPAAATDAERMAAARGAGA